MNKEEQDFLRSYDLKKYERPAVTADVALFKKGSGMSLLLIKRGGHPSKGLWALPGGFLNEGETLEEAAERELFEETSVRKGHLTHIGVFSEPKRDPRGWIITNAYMALVKEDEVTVKAGDDAKEAEWFEVKFELKSEKGFDELGIDIVRKKYNLTLTSKEVELTAIIEETIEELHGRKKHVIIEKEINGLAFDHSKIVATAILQLIREGHWKES